MAKKEITQAMLEARQRMEDLISDNSEKRVFIKDIKIADKDFSATNVIENPALMKSLIAIIASFYGSDPSKTAIVFKKASVSDVVTANKTVIPHYQYEYCFELFNNLNTIAYKGLISASIDTANGLVITEFKTLRCQAAYAYCVPLNKQLPANLGETNLKAAVLDFLIKTHNLMADLETAKTNLVKIAAEAKEFSELCSKISLLDIQPELPKSEEDLVSIVNNITKGNFYVGFNQSRLAMLYNDLYVFECKQVDDFALQLHVDYTDGTFEFVSLSDASLWNDDHTKHLSDLVLQLDKAIKAVSVDGSSFSLSELTEALKTQSV